MDKVRAKDQSKQIRQEDLDKVRSSHKLICDKVTEALLPLQEALKLSIELNKKLTSGVYRDSNSNRQMYVNNLLQNIDVANKQLVRTLKMSKIMSSNHLEQLEEDLNTGAAFK